MYQQRQGFKPIQNPKARERACFLYILYTYPHHCARESGFYLCIRKVLTSGMMKAYRARYDACMGRRNMAEILKGTND